MVAEYSSGSATSAMPRGDMQTIHTLEHGKRMNVWDLLHPEQLMPEIKDKSLNPNAVNHCDLARQSTFFDPSH